MTNLFPWMAMIDVAGAASAVEAVEAVVDATLEAEASPAAVGEAVTQQSIMGWGSGWSDSLDVAAWWTHLTQFLTTKGTEFLLHVVEALVIFVVGRWVALAVTRGIGRVAAKANVDQTLIRFTRHLIYAAMLSFVVLSALNRLGIDTTSFTAVVGAAGLAIGFALQGSLSNFAAGVLLIVFKPFKVGDNVTAGGSSGVIEEIQIFNTIFKSGDNATIIVPNGAITSGTIINHSQESTRRMDLLIKCGYNDDLREVKRFLVDLLYGDERILQLPPPSVSIDQLGDSAITLSVQPWVRSEDFSVVRGELLEAIKIGFDERGFNLRPAGPSQAGGSPSGAANATASGTKAGVSVPFPGAGGVGLSIAPRWKAG